MSLMSRARRPLARLGTVAAASALVLASCTGGGATGGGSDAGGGNAASEDAEQSGPALAETGTSAAADLEDPAADPAYAAYYEQDMVWSDCGATASGAALECATISVPVQWDDPDAGDIDLALVKHVATGAETTGSLFVNPGGPGGSGVDFATNAEYTFSADVLASYDVIGFDPRGVGQSAGIDCLSDEELDERRAADDLPLTEEGFEAMTTWGERTAEGCEADSGELLPYLDTLSAARDLDVMRDAVGSEQLDYLGFSYGTYLGATYAETYPDRVGSFVLDGAIDPSLTGDEFSAGQAEAFEGATDAFIEACLDAGEECPLEGEPAEAKQQLLDFLASVEEEPLPTDDPERPLTGSLARSGLLILMYEDGTWSLGRDALTDAMDGDGTALLSLADQGANRNLDGSYNGNSAVAITAVNCLDHPAVTDMDWQRSEAERLAEENPTFGPIFGFSGYACSMWPEGPVREPAEIHAEGAGPIVVIGTTGDPATPYSWAEALAAQLDSGVLVTREGEGHTAYGRSGGCIEDLVDAYLLEDEVPAEGATC